MILEIPNNWKEKSIKINCGSFRKIYIFKGFILKILYKKTPFNNYIEFRNYKKIIDKIPKNFKIYFYEIYNVQEINNEKILISELILNEDKNIAKSILDFGKIDNKIFWKIFDEIINMMIEKKIYFYDINSKNILVKNTNDGLVPIFIDYKKFWRKFNFQLDLIFKKRKVSKMIRNYNKLKMEFQI